MAGMVLAGIGADMLGVEATAGAVAGAGMVGITITVDTMITMIITIIMTMTITASRAAVVGKITTKAAAVTTTDAIRPRSARQGLTTVLF
jgi:hypothetical protein